jgi:hypothetical protein
VQTYLFAGGTNGQYDFGLYLRLPVRTGALRVVNTNGEFDGPGVQPGARVTLTTNTATRRNQPVDLQGQTMQITGISADWIEGTYSFYVGTDRQAVSQLAFRFRNQSATNTDLKTRSGDEANWNYADALRKMAYRTELDSARSTATVPVMRTVPFVEIQQANVPVGLSAATLNNRPLVFVTQTARLLTRPTGNRQLELTWTDQPVNPTPDAAANPVQVTVILPDFKGVGTYAPGQSRFVVSQTDGASGESWAASTGTTTGAATPGQVTVTKVTAGLIEGTYTLTDAPVTTPAAGAPASVRLTGGSFRVIYPR